MKQFCYLYFDSRRFVHPFLVFFFCFCCCCFFIFIISFNQNAPSRCTATECPVYSGLSVCRYSVDYHHAKACFADPCNNCTVSFESTNHYRQGYGYGIHESECYCEWNLYFTETLKSITTFSLLYSIISSPIICRRISLIANVYYNYLVNRFYSIQFFYSKSVSTTCNITEQNHSKKRIKPIKPNELTLTNGWTSN